MNTNGYLVPTNLISENKPPEQWNVSNLEKNNYSLHMSRQEQKNNGDLFIGKSEIVRHTNNNADAGNQWRFRLFFFLTVSNI